MHSSSLRRVEPRLARNIQAQSAGSPVFAIQMVGSASAASSRPATRDQPQGRCVLTPSSIEALWFDRLDGCLAGLEDGAMEAIRVGAALGEGRPSRLAGCAVHSRSRFRRAATAHGQEGLIEPEDMDLHARTPDLSHRRQRR